MNRFESLNFAPAQTRITLRDRFARLLQVNDQSRPEVPASAMSDEVVLELFRHLGIVSNSDETRARPAYDLERQRHTNQPAFDQLAARGIVLSIWGNVHIAHEVIRALQAEEQCRLPALLEWQKERFAVTYSWSGETSNDDELRTLVNSVLDNTVRPETIVCQSPEWVAARLWERLDNGVTPESRIKRWCKLWSILRYPTVVPQQAWAPAQREQFIETALAVLADGQGLPDVTESKQRYLQVMANASLRDPADYQRSIPDCPKTLVDRAVWLRSATVERSAYELMHAAGILFCLSSMLVADICATEHSGVPNPVAQRLFKLGAKYPDILNSILHWADERPKLLADMVLAPKFSALACLLISRWRIRPSAWDREVIAPELHEARDTAFSDAVALLEHHLKLGALAPAEAAALFRALYSQVKPGNIADVQDSETQLAVLRSALLAQEKDVQLRIFEWLVSAADTFRLGTAEFSAALDLLDSGQLVGDVSPEPLVSGYVESVVSDEFLLSAARVSPGAATALYTLAQQCEPALSAKFLFPFELVQRLETAENIFIARDELARGVQVHMRVLARVVAEHPQPIPADLFDAFLKTVKAGAIEDDGEGRVAAMAVGHETDPYRGRGDRPLATDLSAAVTVLEPTEAAELLGAILETNEPAFLAQLLGALPMKFRKLVERRISELAPQDAGATRWLTDRLVRIEELLNVGALEAAEAYIAADDDKPEVFHQRVALSRLRAKLRLAFLKKDWDAIHTAEMPKEVQQAERDEARDSILFYQGAAQLARDDGDATAAEKIFAYLHQKKRTSSAYATNHFAARVQVVVGANPFERLRGAALTQASQYLSEAKQVEAAVAFSTAESDIYFANKAILLLAVGRSDEAARLLRPMLSVRLNDRIAAFHAVALARAGHLEKALAALDWAEAELGGGAMIEIAREHLGGERSSTFRVGLSEDDNPLPRIKEAIGDMLRLDPEEQARVWRGNPRAFERFVIEHVCHASASLTSLVARLKTVKIDSKEDDVSAMVRELLRSRLAFVSWGVSDQSTGGFTAAENPAERDLVISKDGSDLVLFEAVVCRRSPNSAWMEADLKSHFQKLLASSTCHLFFHLTYAYVRPISAILEQLENMARDHAPGHCSLKSIRPIKPMGTWPPGFEAHYSTDVGEILVVFLVLDLAQEHMRDAAKLAASNEARGRRSV